MQQEIAASGAPGVAVAVVRGDRVIYAQGFGVASAETKAAVSRDTLFQIGSATKMLTAAALMSAHAAKSIDVDAPVSAATSAACSLASGRPRSGSCSRTPAG